MLKLRYLFQAENRNDLEEMTVIFAFPDTRQVHSYAVRHCILEYHTTPDLIPKKLGEKITLNSDSWKNYLREK